MFAVYMPSLTSPGQGLWKLTYLVSFSRPHGGRILDRDEEVPLAFTRLQSLETEWVGVEASKLPSRAVDR